MDIAFMGLIQQSLVVYLDDITMFSNKISYHLCHLKQIFEWRKMYGISLNPKRIIFLISKGNILGHIIAKSGIVVDHKWVK